MVKEFTVELHWNIKAVKRTLAGPVFAEDSEAEFFAHFSPVRDRIQANGERLLTDEVTLGAYGGRLTERTDRFAQLADRIEEQQPKT
jgi:hypothetical protein